MLMDVHYFHLRNSATGLLVQQTILDYLVSDVWLLSGF